MASLIAIYRGGKCISRCDARCYEAEDDVCDCQACGGINHGVGLRRASDNSVELLSQAGALPEGDEFRLEPVQQALDL
jgi:hypothetical protein